MVSLTNCNGQRHQPLCCVTQHDVYSNSKFILNTVVFIAGTLVESAF